MALVVKDRVRETSTTQGTGTFTLAGAVTGYQSFSAIGNGNTTYYTIYLQASNEWEVGIGTYTASGTTLSRDTILASSNGGAVVNFSAGTKDVFVTYPADRSVYYDTATNVTVNQLSATTVDTTNIEVTNIKAKDGTAALSIADSTGVVSVSANPVLSGGTANGVLYLNGSKSATSGSALTFDGTNFANTLSANASAGLRVTNSNAGSSTSANTAYSNGSDIHEFGTLGTAYGGYGVLAARDAYIYAASTRNIALASDGGSIKFGAGTGAAEQMRLLSTGQLNLGGNFTSTNNTLQVTGNAAIGGYTTAAPTNGLIVAGDVGLGTDAPTDRLHVVGTASRFDKSNGVAVGQIRLLTVTDSYASGWALGQPASSTNFAVQYFNGSSWSTAATVDTSGNLGLGVTNPAYPLDIADSTNGIRLGGAAAGANYRIYRPPTGGDAGLLTFYGGQSSYTGYIFSGVDGERARITSGGTFQTSLDASIYGVTVGRGAGAVSTNTAVGASALAANTTGAINTAVGYQAGLGIVFANANVAVGDRTLTAASGAQNTAIGSQALQVNIAANNSALGFAALNSNTSGSQNVAIGSGSLQNNTTASNNTAVGYQAAYSNTFGANNTAVGHQSGYSNSSGSRLAYFGYRAGFSNTTGVDNVAIGGTNAMYFNTFGSYNIAIGTDALVSNVTGSNNTAVGYQALYTNTGGNNTALGYRAAYAVTTATNVVAIGDNAYLAGTTGGQTVAVGTNALLSNTAGSYNVAVGQQALQANTTASYNTAVGYQAGYSNTTGFDNTFVGTGAAFNVTTSYNTLLGLHAGYGFGGTSSGAGANVMVGWKAGYKTTSGSGNTFIGTAAGYENTTGTQNTFVGPNTGSYASGYLITGSKNSIFGGFNGNQGGLDIRNANNYIVLSDGDGNPRGIFDASGNLSVGTTSNLLSAASRVTVSVNGTSSSALAFGVGDTRRGHIYVDGTETVFAAGQSGQSQIMALQVNGAERARITSGGYFKASNDGTYYGSTFSYHELRTSATNDTAVISNTHASSPYGVFLAFTAASPDNNTNYFLKCDDSTATRCYIYSDGDLANHDGVYGTISDQKLKQDIVDAGSQWDDIKAIRFRKYRMKSDVAANPDSPALLGVIAQELEQVSPGLVDEHPDMETVEVTDEDGNVTQTQQPTGTTTKTVKSSILLIKAAVALQEAMARIEKLEAEVAALKGV